MKIFEKIKINIRNGKIRQIRFCDIPIIEYGIENNKKIRPYLVFFHKRKINRQKSVFYLKINRDEEYTYLSLQHWLDTIALKKHDFFILCDNQKLERNVLRKIVFADSNIKFIRSMRNAKLQKIVEKIATKWWSKATFAHLTTFFHARKNSITNFWNIDADDTMFVLDTKDIDNVLTNVEDYSVQNGIRAISLDMWHSRTRMKHWSFGITYINNFYEVYDICEELADSSWQKNYTECEIAFNLDWFFTYLKEFKHYRIESFYVSNCLFIHWGNFLINPIGSNVCYWQDGYLNYPILIYIYNDEVLGRIPIALDCKEFHSNAALGLMSNKLLFKHVSNIKFFPQELKRLHNIK